jgi:hypothetical protein
MLLAAYVRTISRHGTYKGLKFDSIMLMAELIQRGPEGPILENEDLNK